MFSPSTLFAGYENPQEALEVSDEERNPSEADILHKKSEKYLHDESSLRLYNSELGIYDERYWTGRDRHMITASAQLNGQFEYLSRLNSFDFSYRYRSKNWHKLWYSALYKSTQTDFRTITQNRSSNGSDTEGAFQRPNDADQAIQTFGLGASYRFKFLPDFLNLERWFVTTSVYATYNTLAEDFTQFRYRGWGMIADYGLHYRSRTSFFFGGKFTYNLAWVERSQRSNESQSDRSLSLGWFSLGLEMGILF